MIYNNAIIYLIGNFVNIKKILIFVLKIPPETFKVYISLDGEIKKPEKIVDSAGIEWYIILTWVSNS